MPECLENPAARLVRAAQRGSGEAFQQLAHGCDHPILRLALRITGSEQEAQSIYRETFVELQGELGSIRSDDRVCLGAYCAAARLCLEYLRTRHARNPKRPALDTLSPHERL